MQVCMQAARDTRAAVLREVDKKTGKLLTQYAIILPQAHLAAASIRLLVEHKDNKVTTDIQDLCCSRSITPIFGEGARRMPSGTLVSVKHCLLHEVVGGAHTRLP
jgi:hypothetical protein